MCTLQCKLSYSLTVLLIHFRFKTYFSNCVFNMGAVATFQLFFNWHCSNVYGMCVEISSNKLKRCSFSKIILTFHCEKKNILKCIHRVKVLRIDPSFSFSEKYIFFYVVLFQRYFKRS